MDRRLRIGELPYSFFGSQAEDRKYQKLYLQLQANNDHLMSQLRKMARVINQLRDETDKLTSLVSSLPEDDE